MKRYTYPILLLSWVILGSIVAVAVKELTGSGYWRVIAQLATLVAFLAAQACYWHGCRDGGDRAFADELDRMTGRNAADLQRHTHILRAIREEEADVAYRILGRIIELERREIH